MPDPTRELLTVGSAKVALILDDDSASSTALQVALAELGYHAQVMRDAEAALATLRASVSPVAMFFNVEAPGETLDDHSYVRVIGALLEDETLARRHIYAVISDTADDVELTLGKALRRLGAPIFCKPCEAAPMEAYLTIASARAISTPVPPVTATI